MAFFWRRTSESYRYFWWTVVVACFVVTLCYTLYSLAIPLYSQQDHRPDNPGGRQVVIAASDVHDTVSYYLCTYSLVSRSLDCVSPPPNLKSSWRIALTAFMSLYVVLALALIYSKHVRYMADYRQRATPRQSRFATVQALSSVTSTTETPAYSAGTAAATATAATLGMTTY